MSDSILDKVAPTSGAPPEFIQLADYQERQRRNAYAQGLNN